ncbi:hypothetical protein EVG20_g3295 [Dentipellis fragilis]|uniref:Uncharacterized protein n=1 Tax=Dentipellis fragilis TaxID=205917 RepID=A0A4Y9Z3H8_9AGAM|nr:hypothetical protein EVG20_g3295 [Dentipellis fragilis]
MSNASNTLPLDKAGIISTVLEGILYGFSVFMYGVTMWVPFYRRSINRPMVVVATMLFIFSTLHLGIDIERIVEGLVYNRNFIPGGPPAWFANPSEFTFCFQEFCLCAPDHHRRRCHGEPVDAFFQALSLLIITLLCGVITTAVGSAWACAQAKPSSQAGGVFAEETGQWITAFYSSTLSTNLICTDQLAGQPQGTCRHQILADAVTIADAGILYSVSFLSALVCFVSKSNGQYILLDMIMPIISIAFYMIIVRVGIAKVGTSSRSGTSSGAGHLNYVTPRNRGDYGMRPLEVRITQLREPKGRWAVPEYGLVHIEALN